MKVLQYHKHLKFKTTSALTVFKKYILISIKATGIFVYISAFQKLLMNTWKPLNMFSQIDNIQVMQYIEC